MVLEPVVAEHRLAGIDAQVHAAATAAITAVRTAARNVGLAAHRGRTVAAAASDDRDRYFVKKHSGEIVTMVTCR
jgi:hypothetical protein